MKQSLVKSMRDLLFSSGPSGVALKHRPQYAYLTELSHHQQPHIFFFAIITRLRCGVHLSICGEQHSPHVATFLSVARISSFPSRVSRYRVSICGEQRPLRARPPSSAPPLSVAYIFLSVARISSSLSRLLFIATCGIKLCNGYDKSIE